MGIGGDFLAGILTGGYQGIQEGQRIGLANKENDLRQQLIDAQNQQAQAQIGLTRELGTRKAALEERAQAFTEMEAPAQRQFALDLEDLRNKAQTGQLTQEEAARLKYLEVASGLQSGQQAMAQGHQLEMQGREQAFQNQQAEKGVGRAIATHVGITNVNTSAQKSLMDYESNLKQQWAANASNPESLANIQKRETSKNLWDLTGTILGHEMTNDSRTAQLALAARDKVATYLAETGQSPQQITAALTALKAATIDGNEEGQGRARFVQRMGPLMNALGSGDSAGADKAAAQFVQSYMSDSRPSGSGSKPIDLTKPPAQVQPTVSVGMQLVTPENLSMSNIGAVFDAYPKFSDAYLNEVKRRVEAREGGDAWKVHMYAHPQTYVQDVQRKELLTELRYAPGATIADRMRYVAEKSKLPLN